MQLSKYQILPIEREGVFLGDDTRYAEYAIAMLSELEQLNVEVLEGWPGPSDASIKHGEVPDEFWNRARKRDQISDSIIVFSAMAMEGFINFYGVLRLGDTKFAKIERLATVKKLRMLLEICDGLESTRLIPIATLCSEIAARRNKLVHPKFREISTTPSVEDEAGNTLPQVARDAVQDMTRFYQEFQFLVPAANVHLDGILRQLKSNRGQTTIVVLKQ